jgi:hypothetical protein
MHELVQDLDAGCDDVRNDIVQTSAHGPPTREGRDRAGSDAAVSDDHDDPIAGDNPGDRGLLGDKVELFRSHHRQRVRTVQRLVNTSPDIVDDACNSGRRTFQQPPGRISQREKPRYAEPFNAPKRTRTSTQLAWTRPSTWRVYQFRHRRG